MINANIPLPRLLGTNGRTFERVIHPLKVSIDENIVPLSTASIQLQEGDSIPARSYVELFNIQGSAGIYRVRSPQNSYGDDVAYAELEHAIVEVGDYLVRHSYNDMMGASTAISTIWSHYRGDKWQLGSSYQELGTDAVAVQANYDTVLQSIISIVDQIPDCFLTFDFSTTPWTLGFSKSSGTPSAEGRLSRNVASARISYDDSELCTKAYYEVSKTASDGTITTEWRYVDADTQSTYGIIEREVQTGGDFTETEALRAVDLYLRKHKKPKISIEIDGVALHAVTGESFDKFVLGKMFRLSLPDYNTTVEQCITALSWEDVYGAPYSVSIVLADQEDTTVTYLHDSAVSGGGSAVVGGGGSKKQDDKWKEYYTKIEQTDYTVDIYARHVTEQGDILQQAGMYLDSNGVLIYADDNERNVGSKLHVQADRISMTVGTVKYDASKLRTYSSKNAFPATGQRGYFYKDTSTGLMYMWENGAYVQYTLNSDGTEASSIKSGDIILAINENGDTEARLNADRVLVGRGAQTIDDLDLPDWMDTTEGLIAEKATILSLNALQARVGTLEADSITTENMESTDVMFANFNANDGEFTGDLSVLGDTTLLDVSADTIDCSGINIDGDSVNLLDAEVEGNTLKIWKVGDQPNAPSITFSKATSLSGAWSGSLPKTLTVTASPQGNTYQVQFDGTYSATRTNLEVSLGGSISIETVMGAKMLSIPVNISRLTGTSSAPDIVYQTNISAAYNALLETRSVSANGTYTPRSDYIGIGSITVTVPNTMLVDAVTGTATIGTGGSSSLMFSAGITYSSATHTYVARAIVDGVDMEPRRAASGTEAYTDGKTDGHGEMGIEADAQNSLVKVVQGSTKSLSITIPNPTFNYNSSTHKYRVTMTAKAGDTTVATATSINASGLEAYNDGWDGCVGTKTWVGEASKTLSYGESVNVAATIKDKNGNTVSIGAATYVAPPDRYESGWSAAYGKVKLPAVNTNTASATFEIPKSSVNNTADQKTYTLGLSSTPYNFNTKVYLFNPDRSAVAALSVGTVYNAGVDEGNKNRHSIVLFSETTETPTITVKYGKTYKAQSQYQAYDGTWHDDYKEIFTVPPDRWQEGYDAGAGSVSHSPSASASFPWTGSIAGRTSLGKVSYTSLHNSYILIDAKCGGETKGYYITVN